MSDELTFGSLFTGIGGLDLGLERAGWTVRWQVERDEWCRRVLAKHWPDVPRYGDVHVVGAELEHVDLIAGGFPCQPVSLAGRRRGAADERWLWPEFARLIRLLRPRYVLVENVPGLLAGDGMAEVLGDLAALGFDAEWECIPAAAVGAPHLRWRVFVVAYAQRPERGTLAEGRHDANGQDPRWQEATGRTGANGQARRAGDVADTDPGGRDGRAGVFGTRWRRQPAHGGEAVVDAEGVGRREGPWVIRGLGPAQRGWWSSEPELGGTPDGLPSRLDGTAAWERGVPRVAKGVPQRVDRLKGLGNAVVPQVAEVVGRMIAEHMRRTAA